MAEKRTHDLKPFELSVSPTAQHVWVIRIPRFPRASDSPTGSGVWAGMLMYHKAERHLVSPRQEYAGQNARVCRKEKQPASMRSFEAPRTRVQGTAVPLHCHCPPHPRQQPRDFVSVLSGSCEPGGNPRPAGPKPHCPPQQCLSSGCSFKGRLAIEDRKPCCVVLVVSISPEGQTLASILPDLSITLCFLPSLSWLPPPWIPAWSVSQKLHSVPGKGHVSFTRQSGRLPQKHHGPRVRPAMVKPQNLLRELCVS